MAIFDGEGDVYGTDGADDFLLRGGVVVRNAYGAAGDDRIAFSGTRIGYAFGEDGDDTLIGDIAAPGDMERFSGYSLWGGDGRDVLSASVHVPEGLGEFGMLGEDGEDKIEGDVRAVVADALANLGDGDDVCRLSVFATDYGKVVVDGGAGDDLISVRMEIVGPDKIDSSVRFGNIARVWGGDGDDRVKVEIPDVGRAEIYGDNGGTGDDHLTVIGGTDNLLAGNQGDDTLLGSDGDDRLIGGQGRDYMRGFDGDDTFVFQNARGWSERDRIKDFTSGEDVFDLSRIDANVYRAGNQSFTFAEADEFHGTGRVWIEDRGVGSVLRADTGGEKLVVLLLDGRAVDAEDYGAGDFIL